MRGTEGSGSVLRRLLEPLLGAHPARDARRAYAGALLVLGLATALAAWLDRWLDLSTLTMVFLLDVVVTAVAFGRGPATLASVASAALFNFLFVPPRFTFHIADPQHLLTFAVLFVVAMLTGSLTAWLREQLDAARLRERHTNALFQLSHDLAISGTTLQVFSAAVRRIAQALDATVAAAVPEGRRDLHLTAGELGLYATPAIRAGARLAIDGMRSVDFETGGRPGVHAPLGAGLAVLGVVTVVPATATALADPERQALLRVLTSQTALALERCRLAEDAQHARTQAEVERTRNALLSSVSHDLRTPLAAITGAASSLRDGAASLPLETRQDLAEMISDEARRLNRRIANLLDMTRLESGTLVARTEWHSVEELLGAVLARMEPQIGRHPVAVRLPPYPPLVPLDDSLFEPLLANLIENAARYSPPAAPIDVTVRIDAPDLEIAIADRGPGLPAGEEHRIFEKFYRAPQTAGQPGAGLGLAIARGIAEVHGGTLQAGARPGGGAVFTLRLPLGPGAPPIDLAAPGLGSGGRP